MVGMVPQVTGHSSHSVLQHVLYEGPTIKLSSPCLYLLLAKVIWVFRGLNSTFSLKLGLHFPLNVGDLKKKSASKNKYGIIKTPGSNRVGGIFGI